MATNYKVPQAYQPDPGQLVMLPEQSTVTATRGGAQMVWVGVIIGGAFIAAACLWGVNALLERSVQSMVERNNALHERVRTADRQIAVFEQRKRFFDTQRTRLTTLNAGLEAQIRRPGTSGRGGGGTSAPPDAPRGNGVPP